jgi:hypothetical protein
MAFADPNPNNNGQILAPGNSFDKGGNRENPSGGHIPPGQATPTSGFGNPGQCQTKQGTHDDCHS